MDRWTRFEKQFPFYQTDIDAFYRMLERAMRFTYIDYPNKPVIEIKVVSLEAMQEAFRCNKTWSVALTSDPPTKFV